MSTPTFFIRTLGCKVNRAESETLAAALLALGWLPAASAHATLAVLSTCTVTGEADAKNRKVLRALLRQGPQHVIVTGCAVNMDAAAYASLDARIVCVADKAQLPEVAQRLVCQQEAGDREPPAASNPLVAREFGAMYALAPSEELGAGADACAVQGNAATHGFAPAGGSRAGGNARDAQGPGAARGFGNSERPGLGADPRAAQGGGAGRGLAPVGGPGVGADACAVQGDGAMRALAPSEGPHVAPNPRDAQGPGAARGFGDSERPGAGANSRVARGDGAGRGLAPVGGPGVDADACAVQGDAAKREFAPSEGPHVAPNPRVARELDAARAFAPAGEPHVAPNPRVAQEPGAARGFAPAGEPHLAPNPRNARETAAERGFAPSNSPTARPLFRTRVDVKIQDGCDNACSYCIVHAARGPARSEPADEVVERVAQLAESGTQEVVLVGIDIGAYRDGTLDLAGLLRRLLAETDIGRVRISSIEPQSLTPALLDVLAHADGRVCRHLHVCLQSGSTSVLRQMNRGYSAGEFAELVSAARARIPGLALSTDVIVGFPGETDEDFERTCQLVRQCGFMRLHVFRYSKRPGTPAAERANQVPAQVMAARAARLRELGAALAARDAEGRIGSVEQVIVERPGHGTAESYHSVAFAADAPQGALLPMRFTAYDEQRGLLVAEPC